MKYGYVIKINYCTNRFEILCKYIRLRYRCANLYIQIKYKAIRFSHR